MTTSLDPDRMRSSTTAPRPPGRLVVVEESVFRVDVCDRERRLLLARRQALIIELGGIEEYLGMERSIVPRRKR